MTYLRTPSITILHKWLLPLLGALLFAAGAPGRADHLPPGILVIHFRTPPDYMQKPAGSGPYTKQDIQEAMQLAKIGDAEAQSNLGVMLASRGEYAKAAYWEEQAANAGLDTAAYNLGTLYFNGEGFPKDYVTAHHWFMQSADRGNMYAEFQLAMTYNTGQGVQKDPAKEIYWYEKAARQGLSPAQYNLAVIYHNGDETARDDVKAYAWMLLAKKGGLDAGDALKIISREMSPAQIQEAEKLSRNLAAAPVQDMRK